MVEAQGSFSTGRGCVDQLKQLTENYREKKEMYIAIVEYTKDGTFYIIYKCRKSLLDANV